MLPTHVGMDRRHMRPYVEKRGTTYRVRARKDGKLITLGTGFASKEEAEAHGWEQINKIHRGTWIDPRNGEITLTEWANAWLPAQDLVITTRQQYEYLLTNFVLPSFGERTLNSLAYADFEINEWEARIRTAYSTSTARQARGRLENLLHDAVTRQLIPRNPAVRPRGRGSIEARRVHQNPTKTEEEKWTTPLGALLIAERASLLTRRPDEFVLTVTVFYTGLRFGEVIGLQRDSLTLSQLRVDWQLYELDNGSIIRKLPKDGLRRTVDLPPFLSALLHHQLRSLPPQPQPERTCPCVKFLGDPDYVAQYGHPAGVHLFPGRPGRGAGRPSPHHRRNGFGQWIFHPAAEGQIPRKGSTPRHPVPLKRAGWTGIPISGTRNAAERSEMSWLPIAPGLTPHGLRHSHKTLMEEARIHRAL